MFNWIKERFARSPAKNILQEEVTIVSNDDYSHLIALMCLKVDKPISLQNLPDVKHFPYRARVKLLDTGDSHYHCTVDVL